MYSDSKSLYSLLPGLDSEKMTEPGVGMSGTEGTNENVSLFVSSSIPSLFNL